MNNLIVNQGRVAAVGDNEILGDILSAGNDITRIDLHGRTVLPGFCACNFDFLDWSYSHEILDLSLCEKFLDVKNILKAFVKNNTHPLRGWIIGRNLSDTINITADDLDDFITNYPCAIFKSKYAVFNTQAMLATGQEGDFNIDTLEALKIIPPLNSEDIIYLIKTYSTQLAALGFTEVWLTPENYQRDIFFEQAYDLLPFRVRLNYKFDDNDALNNFLAEGIRTGDGRPLCKAGAIIISGDNNPYEQALMIENAHNSGMQIICDNNKTCFKVLERANRHKKIRTRDLIFNPDENIYDRMKNFGMGGIVTHEQKNLEPAFQNGIILSAGYEDINLTRPLKDIANFVENGLTLAQAINLYTWGGAWNGHNERRRGEISIGSDADLIILERDPFLIKTNEIGTIDITMTFCAGELVYNSGVIM